MVGEMFATAVQVLDPHIVLHVSISKSKHKAMYWKLNARMLTCICAYEHRVDVIDSASQAMSSNFYSVTTSICS